MDDIFEKPKYKNESDNPNAEYDSNEHAT